MDPKEYEELEELFKKLQKDEFEIFVEKNRKQYQGSFFTGTVTLNFFLLKYGKIIPSESTQSIIRRLEGMDIVPIGRFATWTPHFDTEDAIKTIDYMLNNR